MASLPAHRSLRRLASRTACLALASCLLARSVAADSGDTNIPPASERGLPRELFWLSGSATLLSASLAGLFGLRAFASYDRARALLKVDPARFGLRDAIERDERISDYLFAGAGLLAAASVLLALFTDWHGQPNAEWRAASAGLRIYPSASRAGAALSLRGELP
jgi:hypothetical protein